MATISVFGGGAWGRALASAFRHKNETFIISEKTLISLIKSLKKKHKKVIFSSLQYPLMLCPLGLALLLYQKIQDFSRIKRHY